MIEYIEELENKLKSNKYGLYWDKSIEKEEVEYKLIDYIPYLNKIDEMSILNGGLDNILIEGDNYHALSLLNMINTSDGLIDIIYIDPPYNTGNKEDGYRHSKWLNFMEKRLVLDNF